MSNKQRFAIILLSLLALAPPYAIPRTSAMQAVTQEGGAEDERLHQDAVSRELEAFHAAQVSLRQAIGIAEKLHIGSRTADISFDGASGSPVYRVKTVQHDRLWEHAIDAKTGDTIGTEQVASGRAIGGSLMEDNGKLNFVIVVVSGGSDLKQVVLEPPQTRRTESNSRHGSQ
jgi:hypothetical protein